MSLIRISVITVCFNASERIEQALRSVQSQGYGHIEKVFVDGGSTDGTQKIIRKYLSPKDKFVSERDAGIYDAMNKGVQLATGDIIYFLNSDDMFFDNDVLSDIAETFAADGRREVVHGKVLYDKGKQEESVFSPGLQYRSVNDFLDHSMCHQAVFAKKEMFRRIGGFDLRYRYAADRDWLIRAYKQKPDGFYYIDRAIAVYYYMGQSFQQKMKTVKEAGAIVRCHFSLWTYIKYWIRYRLLRGAKKFVLNEPW